MKPKPEKPEKPDEQPVKGRWWVRFADGDWRWMDHHPTWESNETQVNQEKAIPCKSKAHQKSKN